MMSSGQVYSLIDDDEDDDSSSDVRKTKPEASCPSYLSPGGFTSSTPRHSQFIDQPCKREKNMDPDVSSGHFNINNMNNSNNNNNNNSGGYSSSVNTGTTASVSMAMKQREVSEYTYAQALLRQAPKLSSCGDLDQSSVLRLAQAYITLQQGLQSRASTDGQTKWWPDDMDGGRLALAAQQTMGCFMLIVTSQGNIVYVSDAVEMLLGHDQLNLVGRSIHSLVHPEELPVLHSQFSLFPGQTGRLSAQRSFYTRMLNMWRSGSQQRRFELVHAIGHLQEVALASNSTGQNETWLMCACRVMTPQVEEEGIGSPFVEWVSHNALDGKYIYIDARSCQVSGYLPNEVIGLSPYCFVHQDDQEHVAFSHNQALINVRGSSCTYRMYTRSQDVVYVHTTIQLARDKHTNKPKFLFCLHNLVDEREGREQVSRHQQELMWVKADPSIKYSMTDIERAVKALEAGGGSSHMVMSKGGMKNSVLTDSFAGDGGDLLSINLSHHMRIPPLTPKQEPGLAPSSSCQQQRSHNSQYSMGSQYQQSQNNMLSPTSLPPTGTGYGDSYNFDNARDQPMQQQVTYNRQYQQQSIYTSQRPQYQQQMSSPSAVCHTMLPDNSGGDSPVPGGSTGSFVDYLFDNSGPPSVPSDNQGIYTGDALINQALLNPTGRARGRGRTRGRPRGSGRGGRGVTRGVRGTRGSRGRGSRARGRGSSSSIAQLSQLREAMGNTRKSDSILPPGSISPISTPGGMSPRSGLSPMGNSGDHVFMSPNSGLSLQRSLSTGGSMMSPDSQNIDFHRLTSEGDGSPRHQSDNLSGIQGLHGDDSIMFQRMQSLDGIDMLDPGSDFGLHRTASQELMSPRSWGNQDRTPSAQIPPYRTMSGMNVSTEKRVGRPRGSKSHIQKQQHFQRAQSLDDPSISAFTGTGSGVRQSLLYNQGSTFPGQSPNGSFQSQVPQGGSSNSLYGKNQQAGNNRGNQEGSQRSVANQGQTAGHMTPDTDPEHSILGNLLKGRGGSTSSAGSKSPAQSMLPGLGRSPSHAVAMERGGRSPSQPTRADRGGRSPAHSLISDVASPVSVFSPDSSRNTPSAIKDEPELLSPMAEMSNMSSGPQMYRANQQLNSHLSEANINTMPEQVSGSNKTLSEMHMFSAQLRQKHRSLEESLISQDNLLRQLESNMQQAAKDSKPGSLYANLNARLDIIKADKAKQEKELRVIQAKLEAQVRQQQQYQLQQQQPQLQQQRQPQQQQQQHLDLQRHRLSSPVPTNPRRMAIVPPLQRQPTEGELNPGFAQHNPGDLKSGHSGSTGCASPAEGGKTAATPSPKDKGTKSSNKSGHQNSPRQITEDNPLGAGVRPQSVNSASNHNSHLQPTQPSPFSLHHHHHHHHHYHHHPIHHPASRLSQSHMDFASRIQGTPPPPPPPAYGSYDSPITAATSGIAGSGASTPGALSISVSSTNTSLASPIVCDTSPVSVDESPSCASDSSSGYHSLSHGTDSINGPCINQYNKSHCLDIATSSALPGYSSKAPPAFGQSLKGTGKSPDMISATNHLNNNSSPSI